MNRLWTWQGHAWIGLALRLYLGGVFLVACYHKILFPAQFALDVATYRILPLQLINLQAIVLPWVELLAGVMLILGLRTRAAALLVNGMMVMFIVALSMALYKGLDMSCGCFASEGGDDPISWHTIVRDSTWLAMGLYIMFLDPGIIGVDGWFKRRKNHG